MAKKNKNTIRSLMNDNNGNGKAPFIIGAIIVVIALIIIFFPFGGKGKGDGTNKGVEVVGNMENTENIENKENTEKNEDDEKPTATPTSAPVQKEFSVVIAEDKISHNGTEYDNVQGLIDVIKQRIADGDDILVVLHGEEAIIRTWEDVKNALDKNGIPWTEPTPLPTSGQ